MALMLVPGINLLVLPAAVVALSSTLPVVMPGSGVSASEA